jgi:hypothetical protein
MRSFGLLLTILTIGCSQAKPPVPSGPRLCCVGVGVIHEVFPMAFAIKVTNEGDARAYVDDAQFRPETKTLHYDDEIPRESLPNGFDCGVIVFSDKIGANGELRRLSPGDAIEIAPGATVDVRGAVMWAVPAETPPMLAIVLASFAATNDGQVAAQSDETLYVL